MTVHRDDKKTKSVQKKEASQRKLLAGRLAKRTPPKFSADVDIMAENDRIA